MLISIAILMALIVAFIRWELRRDDPMLQLRMFKISTFRMSVGARLIGFMGKVQAAGSQLSNQCGHPGE